MADDKFPRQADDIPLQKWCNYGATPREIRREIRKAVRAAFPQTKILVKPLAFPLRSNGRTARRLPKCRRRSRPPCKH